MPDYMRAYRVAEGASDTGPIRFIASTEGIKRDGLSIDADAWDLGNYRKNPVVLWSHDYWGNRPPIGKAEVTAEKSRLIADVTFDADDPFAADIERKFRAGYLNAVSVGWDTIEMQPGKGDVPARVTRADLLDISAVPVPGDPDALMERQKRSLADLGREMLRLVEPEAETLTTNMSTTATNPNLDTTTVLHRVTDHAGRAIVLDVEASQRTGWATYKPETTDPEPAADDSARPSWDEASAAMARLYRPYVQRPDDERRAEHQRLAREYARHDRTPPEFVESARLDLLDGEAIRGLFLEGEPELHAAIFAAMESRAGAVLSARNRSDLEQAISLVNGVLERARKEEEKADDAEEERLAAHLLKVLTEKAA